MSMSGPVPAPAGESYTSLLAEIRQRIRAARLRAALAVNQELILTGVSGAIFWYGKPRKVGARG
jgi:hypothetical protein